MMKKYLNTLAKTFLITTIPLILIAAFIYRRFDVQIGYNRVTIGALLIALIIALAIRVFKSEKGKPIVNAILGYIIIVPALLVVRRVFGDYLFSRVWVIYIVIAAVGIIYAIALYVASKKYKTEVDELNRLLLKKEDSEEDE